MLCHIQSEEYNASIQKNVAASHALTWQKENYTPYVYKQYVQPEIIYWGKPENYLFL